MSELEEQACILFELTPSSPDWLWSIASDWLEEHGFLQPHLFKEKKFEHITTQYKITPAEECSHYWYVHGVKNGTGGFVTKTEICYGNEFTCNGTILTWLNEF